MKIVAHCRPGERLPREVWFPLRNAFISIAQQWGVPLDVEETLSVRDAEVAFENDPPKGASE